jgi:hypothetical protein
LGKALRIATTHPVYEAIQMFYEDYCNEDDDIRLDELLDDEWDLLRKIHAFLAQLLVTTKALESNYSTLEHVFPAMDYILSQF